jgi:pilus assembly protein CpaB
MMRMPRMRRPGAWFVVAAALAVGAFVLASGVGSSDPPTIRVLVARQVIPPGTLIEAAADQGALALAAVAEDLPLAGLLSGVDDARGRRTVAALSPGEPLTQAALGGAPGVAPAPLAVGERAVPVPLRSAGGPAVAPVPGARVDVIASDGEGPAGRTRVVVADAEVLAVTREDARAAEGGGDVLLLRLSTAQALDVTRALDFSREVRVVTRPAGEP